MGKVTYNDIFRGEEDAEILRIIERNTSDEKRKIIQKIIVEIIENDLTPKQREVMIEYFFNNKEMKKSPKNREFPYLLYQEKFPPENIEYIN